MSPRVNMFLDRRDNIKMFLDRRDNIKMPWQYQNAVTISKCRDNIKMPWIQLTNINKGLYIF